MDQKGQSPEPNVAQIKKYEGSCMNKKYILRMKVKLIHSQNIIYTQKKAPEFENVHGRGENNLPKPIQAIPLN
jgi:hypothetical protein